MGSPALFRWYRYVLTAHTHDDHCSVDLSFSLQAKCDIDSKKLELKEARVVRQHMEEYEVRLQGLVDSQAAPQHENCSLVMGVWRFQMQVLRSMISDLPSRATTQAEIDKVNIAMERLNMVRVLIANPHCTCSHSRSPSSIPHTCCAGGQAICLSTGGKRFIHH